LGSPSRADSSKDLSALRSCPRTQTASLNDAGSGLQPFASGRGRPRAEAHRQVALRVDQPTIAVERSCAGPMIRLKRLRRYTTSTIARATASPVPRIESAPTTDANQTISRNSLSVEVCICFVPTPACLPRAETHEGEKRACYSRRKSLAAPIGVTQQICRRTLWRGFRLMART
jgi:hypothetical protein